MPSLFLTLLCQCELTLLHCPSLSGTQWHCHLLGAGQWSLLNKQLWAQVTHLFHSSEKHIRTCWFSLAQICSAWAQASASHWCAPNPSASCNSAVLVGIERKMILICPVRTQTCPQLVLGSIISSTCSKLLFGGDYVHTQSDTYNHHHTKMDSLGIHSWCTKHFPCNSIGIWHHCSTNLECCWVVLYHGSL